MQPALRQRMLDLGIDVDRSEHILERFNAGAYDDVIAVEASGIPRVDGEAVIDRTAPVTLSLPDKEYQNRLQDLAPEIPRDSFGTVNAAVRTLDADDLERVGVLLYPYLSYGVLNGGSATSYGDRKKNAALDPTLLELYRDEFDKLAPEVTGKPKGITPAWVNPDGTSGAGFLELKFRMLLLGAQRYHQLARQLGVHPPDGPDPLIPFFEMTSYATQEQLRAAYRRYRESPLLRHLPGVDALLDTATAVQPLLAAFTHSSEGQPREFFTRAYGQSGEPLGLPGGHGQNFQVLARIYRDLLAGGKRFVYIGNVDNIGFTVDPVSLAILALKRAPAGFDFAYRTPVDVKGGVLVYDQKGNLNCADIGPAISREEVFAAEQRGERILFNCATGLFDLQRLCEDLDRIIEDLPMRISDQDKDAGRYSQAEQVTWEVIAMLKDPIVFAIDKYQRFLAAKMLLETLLTSGLKQDRAAATQPTVRKLAGGLERVLRREYGMKLVDDRWIPAN